MIFKSVFPSLKNGQDIFNLFKIPFSVQEKIVKSLPLWEEKYWENEELQKIQIDCEKIDRIYYGFIFGSNKSYLNYLLIARMEYKEKPLYFELSVLGNGNIEKNSCIFISRNANIFMKIMISRHKYANKLLIYDYFEKDNIIIEKSKSPESLLNLCNNKIYSNRYFREKYYKSLNPSSFLLNSLPNNLVENIKYFIKIEETRLTYQNNSFSRLIYINLDKYSSYIFQKMVMEGESLDKKNMLHYMSYN